MFSTDASRPLLPRTQQLCRVLLGVRVVVSVVAVLLLGSSLLSLNAGIAFVFAIVTSALAYAFWRRITVILHRHPVLLGLDTFISLFILTLGGRAGPFLIFTVVTSAIAGLLYRWGGMLYIVTLQAICYTTAILIEVRSLEHLGASQTLFAQIVWYPLVALAGMWIRRLLDEAEQADTARRAAEVATAAERERARLARDMHDSLAKTVRGIAFAAAALPSWINRDPERATQEAGRIAAAAEVASREARDLLTDLRSDQLDQPLLPTLRSVCDEWSARTGIALSAHLDEDVDLGVSPRYELVNVLKEALSNVERHAQASSVDVRLRNDGGAVVLTVTDDGMGYDPAARNAFVAAGHYGLLGMTERARRAGGEIELESSPGAGSTIRLRVRGSAAPPQEAAPGGRRAAIGRRRAEQPVESS